MKTKTIRQVVVFRASPKDVYEALMDSRKHAKFTGAAAHISRKVGGKFSAGGDYIDGIQLALTPDKKIVQSWHASDWAAGHYSRATFTLSRVKGGTRLTFTHSDVPQQHYQEIKQGWVDYYWEKLKKFLEKPAK
jgi:activator of HSP90 ATPase